MKSLVFEGGKVEDDPDEIAKHMAKVYDKLFRAEGDSDMAVREPELVENLFSKEDVIKAMEQSNFTKALGEDWMSGDLLNDDKIGPHLINQIVNMLNSGYIPSHLKTARLSMLSKSGTT